LHRAAKAAARVVVYVHKDPRQWLRQLEAATIHRRDQLELRAFGRELIAGIVSRLERRMSFAVSVADAELFVSFSETTISGPITTLRPGRDT
jgi:uncharacterized protein YaeQ